jgi:hypothetical protein
VASLSATHGTVAAPAVLSGLQPGVSYHFRVTVSDADGSEHGAEETLTTYPSFVSRLPDGRVYEMVTPPDNQDAEVYAPFTELAAQTSLGVLATTLPFRAAADGSALAYVGSPTPGGNGNTGNNAGNEYLARRGAAGGWGAAEHSTHRVQHARVSGLLERSVDGLPRIGRIVEQRRLGA